MSKLPIPIPTDIPLMAVPKLLAGFMYGMTTENKLKEIESDVFEHYIQPPLQTYTIEQRFVNVFSWLGMMKMNERIIILIMLIIAH